MATTASSSSQPGRTLPLVDCPQCKVPVVKRLSKNGNIYYKCPNRCGKWWFEDAYELYLRNSNANLLESCFRTGHNPIDAIEVIQQPATIATLPLVDCLQCKVPVVKRLSKNGNIYYKCPNRCGKWWFEDAYELYLRNSNANLLESCFRIGHNPIDAIEVIQQPATIGTLPLVDCLQCKVPVVKRLSKNGKIYYKCPNRCGKWWFEDAYELYLRNSHANLLESCFGTGHNPIGAIEVVQQPAAIAVQGFQQTSGDLKMVALDLKMQLGDIILDIANLKIEVKLNNATIAFVFLGIFVAVLVAIVWKK